MTTAKRIGILGGGQLARMLVIEGFKIGLEMHVMSRRSTDPAAQVTRYWHEGDVSNLSQLTEFFKKVDIVTIESEFMDENTLSQATRATGTAVEPHPQLLSQLSDRLTQKQWLVDNKIPTAPFVAVRNAEDVRDFFKGHPGGIVLKKRRFGYDGYGTFIIRSSRDFDQWIAENGQKAADFIAEEFIPFKRELAVQFAVNGRGEVLRYPVVEWKAQNSRCLWVKGPARGDSGTKLLLHVEKALKRGVFHGVIAFEIFEIGAGKTHSKHWLINEVAPRVHNSGHYTIEATPTNQFQAHLRAILNLPLPKAPKLWSPGFAMWNLLGTSFDVSDDFLPEVQIHWYGKTEARPGRKMGHITALGASGDAALKKLKKAIKGF